MGRLESVGLAEGGDDRVGVPLGIALGPPDRRPGRNLMVGEVEGFQEGSAEGKNDGDPDDRMGVPLGIALGPPDG